VNHPTARGPSSRGHRAGLVLLAGAASAALLSACGAGQVTQTSDQVPAIQGVGTTAGHVTVDNALVVFPSRLEYPAGSDAPLSLVVTNGASTDDRLVSAHSDAARAVVITPAAPGTTPPSGGCVRSPNQPEPPGGPRPSAPPGSAAQPIPDGSMVTMTPNCPHLLLVGLKSDLTLTDTVPLRLTFASAGTLDLVLPVQVPNSPLPREVVPGVDSLTGQIAAPDSRG
jgi:copper(I)-binding protein